MSSCAPARPGPERPGPARRGPARPGPEWYERRRPEATVLYQLFEEHWEGFLEHTEEQGRPLPEFVKREVEAYRRCGILEHGLLRVGCPGCGFERLVAFSCKKRGICPSCLGRRMTDTACHLRERVIPSEPLRQWVCSLPWELRLRVGYDGALCSQVLRARGAGCPRRTERGGDGTQLSVAGQARAGPVERERGPPRGGHLWPALRLSAAAHPNWTECTLVDGVK